MRPKSEIYTPKRDDEHPRPFHPKESSPGASIIFGIIRHYEHNFHLVSFFPLPKRALLALSSPLASFVAQN